MSTGHHKHDAYVCGNTAMVCTAQVVACTARCGMRSREIGEVPLMRD